MKKRIMIVGGKQSGKSTVANWLNDEQKPLKKRQDAIYGAFTIDIPAAYLENTSMYKYIFSLAQTAAVVLFLANGKEERSVYPPHFAKTFSCPVFGVIKSFDSLEEKREAEQMLMQAGVAPPYSVFDPQNPQLIAQKETWLRKLTGREQQQ